MKDASENYWLFLLPTKSLRTVSSQLIVFKNFQFPICKFSSVRFVVNLPEEPGTSNFVQAVRVKTCLVEGEPCSGHTCRGISTVCR